MTNSTNPLVIGESFARSLDRDDYEAIRPLLSENCCYTVKGETLEGPDQIIASYRKNGEAARLRIEKIVYESEVKASSAGGVEITFIDKLSHAGKQHTYRCRQALAIEDGLIIGIRHQEIPGEQEELEDFLEGE